MASERGNQQAYPDVRRTFRYPNGTETIATGEPGMTIREAFAMAAMQGTAAAWRTSEPVSPEMLAMAARGCVMMSDALLAALAEERP